MPSARQCRASEDGMNPAFSVLLFTTLSGAGYGLLAWVGFAIATSTPGWLALDDPDWRAWLFRRLLVALTAGVLLTGVGLVSSTFHLGKPLRAWRAFSQWRTSWLSREGVLALATWVPAVALAGWCWISSRGPDAGGFPPGVVPWLGAALAVLSLLTVACTAMIYASLKPIPAWRHPLVVPVYLVFAGATGLLVLAALMTLDWSEPFRDTYYIVLHPGTPWLAGLPLLALAAMKIVYWRGVDRIALPSRESATGLEGFGTLATFERPHTEANYLTREMGFVLARKHSRKLRVIAVALFAGVPLLALAVAAGSAAAAPVAFWSAALSALVGAFVERWLFFAEAKHMVMLYY
jgi:DMSO reductase anchor subunit